MKTSGLNRLWPVALLLLRGLVVHGQQVLFTQASDPAGVVNQSAYHAVGAEVSTVTAPMESGANRFTHWTVNGVRDNDFLGCALNPVRIRLDGDTTAVAHYTNGAADADADGVGDWFEWYHLGSMAADGASDGDGDGVPDVWETHWFGGTNVTGGADADANGNGAGSRCVGTVPSLRC